MSLPGYVDLAFTRGDDYGFRFALKDGDGDPIDVTGYTAEVVVLDGPDLDSTPPPNAVWSATTGNYISIAADPEDGFVLALPAAVTATVAAGRHYAWVRVTTAGGVTTTILKGPCTVDARG